MQCLFLSGDRQIKRNSGFLEFLFEYTIHFLFFKSFFKCFEFLKFFLSKLKKN